MATTNENIGADQDNLNDRKRELKAEVATAMREDASRLAAKLIEEGLRPDIDLLTSIEPLDAPPKGVFKKILYVAGRPKTSQHTKTNSKSAWVLTIENARMRSFPSAAVKDGEKPGIHSPGKGLAVTDDGEVVVYRDAAAARLPHFFRKGILPVPDYLPESHRNWVNPLPEKLAYPLCYDHIATDDELVPDSTFPTFGRDHSKRQRLLERQGQHVINTWQSRLQGIEDQLLEQDT